MLIASPLVRNTERPEYVMYEANELRADRLPSDLSKTGCSGANMSQYEGNLTSWSVLIAVENGLVL
jgi:hypothetical protein